MSIISLLPRFRQARKELPDLQVRETWSQAEIALFQLESINRTWRHAIETVPYYRQLRSNLSLPAMFTSIDEYCDRVPLLPKQTVRDLSPQLISDRPVAGNWQRTGGSTGVPTSVFRSSTAHRQTLAARYRMLQQWNVDFLQPHTMVWGHAASFAPGLSGLATRIRRPLEDWLRGRRRLSAYRLGEEDIQQYLHQMVSHRADWLYGYSSAIYLFALTAIRLGIKMPTLNLSVLTAEPVFDAMVQGIEKAFGAPAITEYGSVETGIMATEWPDRTLRVRDDQVFLESLPRNDGAYDIVVTVLNNPSFPLLRFEVGDITQEPIEKPDGGFSILKNVAGRNNDMLQSRSGRLVHALAIKHVLEQCAGILRFRAQQRDDGHLQVTIEQNNGDQRVDVTQARSQLTNLLEGYEVSFDFVDQIPGNQAGKHRWVVSELVAAHS